MLLTVRLKEVKIWKVCHNKNTSYNFHSTHTLHFRINYVYFLIALGYFL